MGWARIADDRSSHPKIVAAGPAAATLDLDAILWSVHHETEGFVPWMALGSISSLSLPRALAAASRLVDVGRWVDVGRELSDVRGGWLIHDFADYQVPPRRAADAELAADVAARRRARVEALRAVPSPFTPEESARLRAASVERKRVLGERADRERWAARDAARSAVLVDVAEVLEDALLGDAPVVGDGFDGVAGESHGAFEESVKVVEVFDEHGIRLVLDVLVVDPQLQSGRLVVQVLHGGASVVEVAGGPGPECLDDLVGADSDVVVHVGSPRVVGDVDGVRVGGGGDREDAPIAAGAEVLRPLVEAYLRSVGFASYENPQLGTLWGHSRLGHGRRFADALTWWMGVERADGERRGVAG